MPRMAAGENKKNAPVIFYCPTFPPKWREDKKNLRQSIRSGRYEKFFPGEEAGGFEFNFIYGIKRRFKRFFPSDRSGFVPKGFTGGKDNRRLFRPDKQSGGDVQSLAGAGRR